MQTSRERCFWKAEKTVIVMTELELKDFKVSYEKRDQNLKSAPLKQTVKPLKQKIMATITTVLHFY